MIAHNVFAEVITDGSLGAAKSLSGTMTIPQNLGTTVGNNLFHSFKTFNINSGESATFTGDNGLKNVISRVTGGGISNINGLLKSEIGNANFYFINPAGIMFGNNAVVDVPAAFHLSTSGSLTFKDGADFSMASGASQLTIAEPAAFGFLTNQAGDIQFQNAQLNFTHEKEIVLDANHLLFDNSSLNNYSGAIAFNALTDLSVINNSVIDIGTYAASNGGNMNLTAQKITVDSSQMMTNANEGATGNGGAVNILAKELAVTGTGELGSSFIASRTFSTGNAGSFAINSDKINLTNGGLISGSTYNMGNAANINLQAKEITIDYGYISSNTNSTEENAGTSGNITINSDSVTVKNSGNMSSLSAGKGNAGNITINSGDVTVTNAGNISSSTLGTGDAGDIMLNSDTLTVENSSQINSSGSGEGASGNIAIQAKNLTLTSDGEISTTTVNGNGGDILINSDKILIDAGKIASATSGMGNAGNITIAQVKEIIIDHGGAISDAAYSTGNAGNIRIQAEKLSLNHYSSINSPTHNEGQAGNITVFETKDIVLDYGASISSNTSGYGNAGSIDLQSEKLTIANIAQLNTTTYAQGNAGNINLQTHNLTIYGQFTDSANKPFFSNISSIATANSNGQTGNIKITATEAIQLYDGGTITMQNDATSATPSAIIPTAIDITTANLSIENGKITTAATGNIDGGNLSVNFSKNLTLSHQALLTTQANLGTGGALTLLGGQLVSLQDADIYTATNNLASAVKGGDITLTADVLLLDRAKIIARANLANGGYANLNLKGLIASQNQLEVNGTTPLGFEKGDTAVNIMRTAAAGWTTPQLNLSGSIGVLSHQTLELPDLNKDNCQNTTHSSLARASKGSIAHTETRTVFVPLPFASDTVSETFTPTWKTATLADFPCAALTTDAVSFF